MAKRVLVVGGGLGALSGAIRLARMGFEVSLFEKNPEVGGKMGQSILGGYRFDTGPSLLTMPFVIDDLFAFAGVERKALLEFQSIEPICRYFYPDGARLDASADVKKMREALAGLSASDAEAYQNFLAYAERIYKLTANIFLFSPIHECANLLRRANLQTLLQIRSIDPFRTVHEAVSGFFKDHRVIQLFDRYATYNGSDPYQAPATLNVIPYVEHGLGSFYIRGGMRRLADALLQVAEQGGVQVHTLARVEKILHDGTRINGLQVNGEKLSADYVLCGQDVVFAFDRLIDGFGTRRSRLKRLEPSCSGIVFLWGIRRKHPELLHHNIFFSKDYGMEFEEIFKKRKPPEDPTIYLAITSKSDPSHAPAQGENWFVLLNMPYLNDSVMWEDRGKRVRQGVLQKLRSMGFDIEKNIEQEEVITPLDFYRRYLSNRGSIYGISSNNRSTAFKRPPNRSRELKGLYFAGGSTHPGGGIPLVLLSGKMAAELIAKQEKE